MTERLPIQTQHCRFCSHLLLSTTRNISTLPRRSGDALDKAIILPLSTSTSSEDSKTNQTQDHTTLLLSTTIPDRRATLIRREDGIEKRILLRCGRCRVVVGYYLDSVHWDAQPGQGQGQGQGEEKDEEKVVYVLPGALVGTEDMGGAGVGEEEWRGWNGE